MLVDYSVFPVRGRNRENKEDIYPVVLFLEHDPNLMVRWFTFRVPSVLYVEGLAEKSRQK